jgi:hypothetical protein
LQLFRKIVRGWKEKMAHPTRFERVTFAFIEFKQTAYALDRNSRKAALARFLKRASGSDQEAAEEERLVAA